jgi:hypothetical protein
MQLNIRQSAEFNYGLKSVEVKKIIENEYGKFFIHKSPISKYWLVSEYYSGGNIPAFCENRIKDIVDNFEKINGNKTKNERIQWLKNTLAQIIAKYGKANE